MRARVPLKLQQHTATREQKQNLAQNTAIDRASEAAYPLLPAAFLVSSPSSSLSPSPTRLSSFLHAHFELFFFPPCHLMQKMPPDDDKCGVSIGVKFNIMPSGEIHLSEVP
jgi:hypothetical protein